jgi:uncharacterized membrane protein YecN with MAPEG domain
MRFAVASVAILGALLFLLGLRVSVLRGRYRTAFGASDDPADPLFRAVRAHGNAAEYVPMLAVLMLLAAVRSPSWWVQGLCLAAVVVRLVHAIAISRPPRRTTPAADRLVGAIGTYLVGVSLATTVLVSA